MITPPFLQETGNKMQQEIVTFGGFNYSDSYRDGELAECENLSSKRWPYLSTRSARAKQADYSGVTAMTAWGELVCVKGTKLLYDGREVGTVTVGEKQFAVVNTKLVIWPDKKYLDLDSLTVKNLGAKATGNGATFTKDTMTVTGWVNLTTLFKVGDCVTISGCASVPGNNKDVVIKEVTSNSIKVASDGFTAGTETKAMAVERKIPDLDYICESENRLWGCSNSTRTIYASSLGDPTNFFVYEGLSTDSYAVAVGSEGAFTGCCKLSSSVLFWKENSLHKMLGSYPAEYSLYTYNIEGLQSGCHKSLQVINETLFYMGIHGVYAYTGGTPSHISANFGNRAFTGAVAGNDGERYFLSVAEGTRRHLFVYNTTNGLWLREDGTECVDFARIGFDLYFLTAGGEVWLADNGQDQAEIKWSAQFTPFYETAQGRKRYSKLLLRLELPRGSWVRVEVRHDGGRWRDAGKAIGAERDVVPLPIAVNRCDKFEVRLTGKGPCAVLSLMRQFRVGSDV